MRGRQRGEFMAEVWPGCLRKEGCKEGPLGGLFRERERGRVFG